MVKLNLGCGCVFRAGWLNIDRYIDANGMEEGVRTKQGLYANAIWEEGAEFVPADLARLPFADNFADLAESLHTLEHLPIADVTPALREIHRVLKPGGEARIFVPGFADIARAWVEMEDDEADLSKFDLGYYMYLTMMIYGHQVHEGEFHRMAFSPRMLKYLLENAGFREVEIRKYHAGDRCEALELAANDTGVLRGENILGLGVK